MRQGASNPQMYRGNGVKILNLDLRGQGRDRESEGSARFFRE